MLIQKAMCDAWGAHWKKKGKAGMRIKSGNQTNKGARAHRGARRKALAMGVRQLPTLETSRSHVAEPPSKLQTVTDGKTNC